MKLHVRNGEAAGSIVFWGRSQKIGRCAFVIFVSSSSDQEQSNQRITLFDFAVRRGEIILPNYIRNQSLADVVGRTENFYFL